MTYHVGCHDSSFVGLQVDVHSTGWESDADIIHRMSSDVTGMAVAVVLADKLGYKQG